MEKRHDELRKLTKKCLAKIMKSKLFKPWGLALLNREIVFLHSKEIPAPAFTTGDYIYLNTANNMFEKYNSEMLLTIFLLHEISHNMLYHDYRGKNKDWKIFNIAGDYVINLIIRDLNKETGSSIKANVELIDENDITMSKQFEHWTEEQVYDYLMKQKQEQKTYQIDLGSLAEETGDPNAEALKGIQGEVTETKIKTPNGDIKQTNVKVPENQKKELQKDENTEKKQIQLARNQLESSLDKGENSSPGQSVLRKLLKIKIDWGKILRNAIKTKLEPSLEVSWGRPKTTWLSDPRMPYLPSHESEESFGMGVVSIDESGSMSNDDVRKAIDIVRQFNQYFSKILILKHDFNIVWETTIENFNEIDIDDLLIRRSCGGTSHQDVFNRIIKETKSEEVSLFIGISDLMSDIKHYQHKISMVPTVWISTSSIRDHNLIGQVISVED